MAGGATELDSDEERELEEADTGGESLFGVIDRDKVRCLNEATDGMGKNPIKPYEDRTKHSPYLESAEDDPELILHIPFTEAVRLRSICIGGGPDELAPSKVHIFVNRDDVDFSIAEDLEPVQVVDLPGGGDMESRMDHALRPGKFHSVHSITLYVPESEGDGSTRIHYVGFKGTRTYAKRGIVEGAVYEALCPPGAHDITEAAKTHSYIGPG